MFAAFRFYDLNIRVKVTEELSMNICQFMLNNFCVHLIHCREEGVTDGEIEEALNIGLIVGGSITIPDATFAEGDAISIFNNTTGNITITCTITTAYIAGTDSDKATMTLATRGVATILFISGTVCVVSGNVT